MFLPVWIRISTLRSLAGVGPAARSVHQDAGRAQPPRAVPHHFWRLPLQVLTALAATACRYVCSHGAPKPTPVLLQTCFLEVLSPPLFKGLTQKQERSCKSERAVTARSTAGRSVRVWDLGSYACVRVLQQPREAGALCALAVGPDGTIYIAGQVCAAASVSSDNNLLLMNTCWHG